MHNNRDDVVHHIYKLVEMCAVSKLCIIIFQAHKTNGFL